MARKSSKPTRKEILQKGYDLGFQNEKVYQGCAQCILAAVQDLFAARDDEVFRAARAPLRAEQVCAETAPAGLTAEGLCS